MEIISLNKINCFTLVVSTKIKAFSIFGPGDNVFLMYHS